jgi:signal transduction histidine kinase
VKDINEEMKSQEKLAELASHLDARLEVILDQWRSAIEADPLLTTSASLTRKQFYDHIPTFLGDFSDVLRHYTDSESLVFGARPDRDAMEHGLDRWHQGYQLLEVLGEWRHLHLCLVDELERIAQQPDGMGGILPIARRELAKLCNEGVCASAMQYSRLQQTEAEGRLYDLERAIEQFNRLETQRAELWHEAAHDLRGSLGAVQSATRVLSSSGVADESRMLSVQILGRGIDSMLKMLNGLLSLARLEAGREIREVHSVDIAVALAELSESLQPLAREKGLYLENGGPASLIVDGDPTKICRIAQNLVLNALQHTEQGGVRIEWGSKSVGDNELWVLRVRDTGRGFRSGSAPIADAIEAATAQVHKREGKDSVDEGAGWASNTQSNTRSSTPEAAPRDPPNGASGEGIGLAIVKRLCELLDATIELVSEPGRGSTFAVTFPRHYNEGSGGNGDRTAQCSQSNDRRPPGGAPPGDRTAPSGTDGAAGQYSHP